MSALYPGAVLTTTRLSSCEGKASLQFKVVFGATGGWVWGRGGYQVDRAADSGPYDPSLITLGEKKENKQKRGLGWPILKKTCYNRYESYHRGSWGSLQSYGKQEK